MKAEFTDDRELLQRHFQKDPVLFAYHLGDLDDFFFDHCRFAVLRDAGGEVEEALLIYEALTNPTVLALGLSDRCRELIEDVADVLPDRFYCHFGRGASEIFEEQFRIQPLGQHFKMKLTTPTLPDGLDTNPNIKRLSGLYISELLHLYEAAYPDNYFDERMLETNKYFGYFNGHRLLAAAGVHVYSDAYNIAVLGNIATLPEQCGNGLGTMVTGRLVQELAGEGRLVCLNVNASNVAARRCYEKLGFVRTHEYSEAVVERLAVEETK